jgi:hypothetical protein
MTTCNKATKTDPDPGMMQSTKAHQEILKKDASIMPVGEPKKQYRVCYLAVESRQRRKKRT